MVRKTATGFACLICHQAAPLSAPRDLQRLDVTFIDEPGKPRIRVLRVGDAEVHRCNMPS